jgi:tRNA-2-methylthio-N6-dimethylallyladenosine synthase
VIQRRFDALVELVQESAYQQNQRELSAVVPVLFEGTSKRDVRMLSGKSPKNQTVHALLPEGHAASDYAGRIFEVRIEEAKTWYLRGSLLKDKF